MQRLIEAMKVRGRQMDAQAGQPRFAIVTSYDANSGAAKVAYQPEGAASGWLPVLSQWTGAGWGMHATLQAGDQVYVIPHEGDADHGVIIGRVYSNKARPPAAGDGEFVLRHASGAYLRLQADGQVAVADQHGASITMQNNGTVAIAGTLLVTGDIIDNNGAHGSLDALRQGYDAHEHTDSRGGLTSTTDHPV